MKRRLIPGFAAYQLPILFAVVVGIPAAALVWLGTRLVVQEQSLAEQQERKQRQEDLSSAVAAMENFLSDVWQKQPEGAVRFVISAAALRAEPAEGVLWLPVMMPLRPAADPPFREGELQEFRGDHRGALAAYAKFRESPDPAVRVGAQLRQARIYWKEKRWDQALHDYKSLAGVQGVGVEGLPVSLVAHRAICSVLLESGRTAELQRETERLKADLLANRWVLDQPAWELTAAGITDLLERPWQTLDNRRVMSVVAERVWTNRQSLPSMLALDGQWMTVLRRTGTESREVMVLPPLVVKRWLNTFASQKQTPMTVALESGEPIAGPPGRPQPGELRAAPAETNLPWTIVARVPPVDQARPDSVMRKRLLMGGLAALLFLVAGGGYLLWRVVQRELSVARLQTDFVAAVSHEFRTPLASLRHVTELLSEDDQVPPDRRRDFYGILGRNTERLQRLVESLLDFARMEEGRKPYNLRPVDVAEFARRLVDEFQKEVAGLGHTVDLEVNSAPPIWVQADEASLGNALWNLLDNAVKYSPNENRVRVAVTRVTRGVEIAVTDKGLGIPKAELQDIFGRFVRGSEAKRLGLKGTGLGLSMVAHIVKAHGGELKVESEAGKGSTFRLVLPEES